MNVKLVADNVTSAEASVTLTTTLFDGTLLNTTVNVPAEPPSTAVTAVCDTVTPALPGMLAAIGVVTRLVPAISVHPR